MYERLEEFARTLPAPRMDGSWDAYYGQHVRNAQRMRAAAFRFALADLAHGLLATGRRVRQALRRPPLAARDEAEALQR